MPVSTLPVLDQPLSSLTASIATHYITSKLQQAAASPTQMLNLFMKPNVMYLGSEPPMLPPSLIQTLNLTGKFIPVAREYDLTTTKDRLLNDLHRRATFKNLPFKPTVNLPPYLRSTTSYQFDRNLPSDFYPLFEEAFEGVYIKPKPNIKFSPDKTSYFVIKQSDKNLGLCAIPCSDYFTMVTNILSDVSYYHLLDTPNRFDHNPVYRQLLFTAAVNLKNLLLRYNFSFSTTEIGISNLIEPPELITSFLDYTSVWPIIFYNIFDSLLGKEEPEPPAFYGIPKIHKPTPSLRPIVALHSYLTHQLSKFIADELNFLVQFCDRVVTSTPDLISRLQIVPQQSPRGLQFISLDIVSLYPNLDTHMNIELLKVNLPSFLQKLVTNLQLHNVISIEYAHAYQRIHFLLDLLEWSFSISFSKFWDQIYLQIFGASMGNPAVPPYAQLALFFMEVPSLLAFSTNISFYGRYFDDVLVLFQGTVQEATAFIDDLNSQQPRIKFMGTSTPATTPTPFLDLLIWVDENGNLLFKPYTKPVSRFLYIPFMSDHPRTTLRGFIIGEAKRLAINSSAIFYWQEAMIFFLYNLLPRGYPPSFILEAFSAVSYATRDIILQKYNQRATAILSHSDDLNRLRLPVKPPPTVNAVNIYGNHQARNHIFPDLKHLLTNLAKTFPPLSSMVNDPIRYVPTNHSNIKDLLVRASAAGRLPDHSHLLTLTNPPASLPPATSPP